MPPAESQRPAWAELFYDLALIGAFLSFGVDFGKDPRWESAAVLALKLVVIFWAWEQSALFFNRFGDPFAPKLGARPTVSLLRASFLAQLIGIVALSLVEGDPLRLDNLPQEIGMPSAAIMLAVALTHELGRRWRPDLADLASARRNAALFAAGLFVVSEYPPSPWGSVLWIVALASILISTAGPSLGRTLERFPFDREHLSERVGLFVLIILGDVFVKTVVTVHEDDSAPADILQLSFVALAVWMVWTLYERNVAAFPAPNRPATVRTWLLAHFVLGSALLIAGIGLVWYVAPAFQKTYGDWIAMVAVGGVGLAILAIAAMRTLTRDEGDGDSPVELLAISAVTFVIGALAWLATPSDWRVGVASMAFWLLLVNRLRYLRLRLSEPR
ncbi:MAG: low temperature requirement protein A [Actinomycetes bacterium]